MTRTHEVMIFSFIFFILGLLFAAVIWLRRQNLDIAQTPEHMIEIRVENNTDEPFENMKFGILDADNTLLEEIDFKETDENTARFWVGYTNTTDFYLKIRTSERFIEETFDIREKNQVDNPQLLLLHVRKEDEIVKIQESP